MPGLAATFLAHAKVRFVPPADASELEGLLVRTWETARAQWPAVNLPAEPFVKHLAERLPEANPDSPIEPLLAQLSLAELYLACACLRGLPAAIGLFERNYLAKLPGLLRGPKQPEAMIDDVCQLARVKLLVPTPEGDPKIAEYTGRGALLSWVRVTAVRIAIKLQAGQKPAPDQDSDTVFEALPAPGMDAELDLIKRRYHNDFRQAVREAFSELPADDRHLLRLYFVDQLSMYELASLFRVNQSTVSRWLKSARQEIYEDTRRRLQARLGLSTGDFKSFLAVLDSQLDLNISQLLGKADGGSRTPGKD
ncbi:sigma-70 family RNA polymerase sigma factor [Archangium lipolyticum]|uniref:sigma-70 family RNA polymerase sigma factor n=1 Tax=Archangium lipolyticum TaxID=2970465 RepID=UPI002DD695D7|nr:sigma-70 family RNA polymerase sigma factor [Archangium lipolyticum]